MDVDRLVRQGREDQKEKVSEYHDLEQTQQEEVYDNDGKDVSE